MRIFTDDSQKAEGPIGDPSRVNPSDVVGILQRRGWDAEELDGAKTRHLALLRKRPREGPSDSMMVRAVAKSSGVPHKVPSSKNQAFIRRPGTSSLIFFTKG